MALQYKDYYKILGVDRNADEKTIKQAYRRLARKFHPDVNKSRESTERFKEINEAYEVLSDPEKRNRYDSLGPDWQRYAKAGAGPFEGFSVHFGEHGADLGDFSEFFRTIFGDLGVRRGDIFSVFEEEIGGRRGRAGTRASGVGAREAWARARGQDVQATVELSLEEAYHGCQKTLALDGRRLEVKIPPGVDTGSRVRVTGGGPSGAAGGERGDLYLSVTVRPHSVFERKGDDLYVELPVSVAEAALGAEVEVPTLKGKMPLKIPPETSSSRTFRLRGYGMPRLKGGEAGDLYVRIKVVMPSGLSARERQLFEELGRLRPEDPRAHLG